MPGGTTLKIERERIVGAGIIDLDRVIDDQIDGNERFDHLGILAHGAHGGTHGGQIDEQGHAGEVLQHDACHHEGDFEVAWGLGVVVGEVGNVCRADLEAVVVAQERLKDDADRDRQAR